jgi:hypothetical protein
MDRVEPALRWLEALETIQIECSRCGGLPALIDVHATARGLMCERCLVGMPQAEFLAIRDEGWLT